MTTILLIAENLDFLNATAELLTFAGFHIITAHDGKMGIQLAQQHQPDVILCDLIMPDMDGKAVYSVLREHALTAPILFVFLTARRDDGLPKGAHYLPKPFQLDTLRQLLDTALIC